MNKIEALIDLSGNCRCWSVEFDELTPEERVFMAVFELESGVNNGGFLGYLENSSGDTAFIVVAALETIGAHQCAEIVRDALACFSPLPPSHEQRERQERLEALGEDAQVRFEQLDQQFFAYPDNLTDLLFAFVRDHKGQIEGAEEFV